MSGRLRLGDAAIHIWVTDMKLPLTVWIEGKDLTEVALDKWEIWEVLWLKQSKLRRHEFT